MSFIDYMGVYDENIEEKITEEEREEESLKYLFCFKGKQYKLFTPCFIVPPVYDVSFKNVFFYNELGASIAKDFLNSILYPQTNSIINLEFLPKEILSNSHLKYNKGTRIVDTAYLATIKTKDLNNDEENENTKVIIDIEMEKKQLGESITRKCFNYGTGIRNENDFLDTWVIALCFDKSKKPFTDKGSNTYIEKEFNSEKTTNKLGYVKIYEIYLNGMYNGLNKISPINEEKIGIIGQEWIKLFCLSLWCYSRDDINFCVPSEIKFSGEKIKDAFKILSDIPKSAQLRIKSELNYEKEVYEKALDEAAKKGFNEGLKEGAQRGFNEGIKVSKLKLLDIFFNKFKSNKSIENIEIVIDKISYKDLIERYGQNKNVNGFAQLLSSKGMLTD